MFVCVCFFWSIVRQERRVCFGKGGGELTWWSLGARKDVCVCGCDPPHLVVPWCKEGCVGGLLMVGEPPHTWCSPRSKNQVWGSYSRCRGPTPAIPVVREMRCRGPTPDWTPMPQMGTPPYLTAGVRGLTLGGPRPQIRWPCG